LNEVKEASDAVVDNKDKLELNNALDGALMQFLRNAPDKLSTLKTAIKEIDTKKEKDAA
jgi:hypothetical protein